VICADITSPLGVCGFFLHYQSGLTTSFALIIASNIFASGSVGSSDR
jgi:hypothetical protein